MKENDIKNILYKDFLKWYKINYWFKENEEPEEKDLKRYLGYFGINRR